MPSKSAEKVRREIGGCKRQILRLNNRIAELQLEMRLRSSGVQGKKQTT